MPNNATYIEALKRASSFLAEHSKDAAAAKYLLLERLKWTETDWLIHLREPIPAATAEQLGKDVERLMMDYPPQYILGYSYFYGRCFQVNQDTLIPRPETEELVQLCLDSNPEKECLRIADIGTGTGCIAITLKKERPAWQIVASDIVPKTLEIAALNAEKQQCSIDFRLGNGGEPLKGERYDIIISNPPYIAECEWSVMDASVRRYEPRQALFAEEDGLAVYRQLARELPERLKETGQVYLEFGYRQGKAVQKIFQAAFPDKQVSIVKDMSGHDRMLHIQ